MFILLFFAFVSGLVTILAPCIWPLLPIIFSSTVTGEKRKPLGITLGILLSFALFTLTISYLVSLFHIDPDIFRLFAVIIIGFLGLTLVVPALTRILEGYVSRASALFGGLTTQRHGFYGGFATGLALGIVWSPCAGPILATIATLAATRTVNIEIILVTIVYVIGIGIPLFLFATVGSTIFAKSKLINKYTGRIQQIFGIIMILTALAIYTNYDKVLQAKLLDAFPAYSTFLYELEGNEAVQRQLNTLKEMKEDMKEDMGQPTSGSGLPVLYQAPEFTGITAWLNVNTPLTMEALRGSVVLIDFWTYTCINCVRTLPHVTRWYDTYKDQGFVVVGVHTPEFEFEKKRENVEAAIRQYGIHYPVPQDNDYATWNAYHNRYWPAKYLIDAKGNVRYVHFGEGKYEETEMAIRDLLKEKGTLADEGIPQIDDQTPKGMLTPETYLGLSRMEHFASDQEPVLGEKIFSVPDNFPLHYFGFIGTWTIADEFSTAHKGSSLILRFYANKVFLVVTPSTNSDTARILLDGKPVDNTSAGKDVVGGKILFDTARLYELIDLRGDKGEHRLIIEFESNTSIFAFTFG